MKTSVSLHWLDKMAFEGELDGHRFVFDAAPESGGEGRGPRPKPFMLFALAGCTGMDVVSILSKMRVEYEKLEITIESEMTEEHPKHYTSMHIIFTFTGKDLPMDKLRKAVGLSEERYCGVSAVYKKVMPVTTEIRLIEN